MSPKDDFSLHLQIVIYHLLYYYFFPNHILQKKKWFSLIKWFGKLWVEKLGFFAVGLLRLECALSSQGTDNVI